MKRKKTPQSASPALAGLPPQARADERGETPIISLDEARQKRQREQQEEEDRAAGEALYEQHAVQLGVLQDLLVEERMDPTDLMDMIKLGILTDDEDLLPCECGTRRESYYDWEEKYYADPEDREEPDEALIDELHQQLQTGYDPDVTRRIAEEYEKRTPASNEVCCPLLSYLWRDVPPPCVEALRARSETEFDVEARKVQVRNQPLDENDPVVQVDLRPCLVLGRELYRTIMQPVWRRRGEDEE